MSANYWTCPRCNHVHDVDPGELAPPKDSELGAVRREAALEAALRKSLDTLQWIVGALDSANSRRYVEDAAQTARALLTGSTPERLRAKGEKR